MHTISGDENRLGIHPFVADESEGCCIQGLGNFSDGILGLLRLYENFSFPVSGI